MTSQLPPHALSRAGSPRSARATTAPIRTSVVPVTAGAGHSPTWALRRGCAIRAQPTSVAQHACGLAAAVLLASHRAIAPAVDAGGAITLAAEWLRDNDSLVEPQIDDVRASPEFTGHSRLFYCDHDGPMIGRIDMALDSLSILSIVVGLSCRYSSSREIILADF